MLDDYIKWRKIQLLKYKRAFAKATTYNLENTPVGRLPSGFNGPIPVDPDTSLEAYIVSIADEEGDNE